MTEWLESKLFRGWFWKEVASNLREWLNDAPAILKAVVGITAGLLGWLYLASQLAYPKSVIRGTGVFLQLLGFILAAYGLERTLEKFGQTPSTSRIFPWVKSFAGVFDTTYEISPDGMSSSTEVVEGSISVSPPPRPPQSVVQRLQNLEQEVKDLNDNLETVKSRSSGEVERLENEIGEGIEAVEEDVERMREKLKEVNAGKGAQWLEWWGVSFFVYGVPLASFPSSFLPAYRVLVIPILAGALLGLLHWYAD